jgi:hypothetical protein
VYVWPGLVRLLPAILATPPYTAVLADAQHAALLARISLAVVLADSRAVELLATTSYAVVFMRKDLDTQTHKQTHTHTHTNVIHPQGESK